MRRPFTRVVRYRRRRARGFVKARQTLDDQAYVAFVRWPFVAQ
jgi:hypothetical protein